MFDYYVDEAAVAMVSWEARVPAFAYAPDAAAAVFVPTMETARLTYLLDTLVARRHHVMFVGSTGARAPAPCDSGRNARTALSAGAGHALTLSLSAGSGKTAIMQHKLKALDADVMGYAAINLNSFSDAPALQSILEQSLEKKSGARSRRRP